MLEALLPVFALIALGYGLGRYELPNAHFWSGAARLTYFLLLPAFLVAKLANPSLDLSSVGKTVIPLLLCSVLVALAVVAYPGLAGPALTSVVQGSVRVNTYLALGVAGALLGERGIQLAALCLGLLIPLVNIISVTALHRYADGGEFGLVGKLCTNPLIIACGLGASLNLSGLALPAVGLGLLEIVGRAALPLGLMTVGAGLKPLSASTPRYLVLPCLAKLLVLPVAVWLTAGWMGCSDEQTTVAVVTAAVPSSASSYILAVELGGDHVLMASIVTVQTAFACATLPLVIALL